MDNVAELQKLLLGDLDCNGGTCKDHPLTCRLIRFGPHYTIAGIASGFIADRCGSLFLLSAGHALRKGCWCLETDVCFDDTHETLLIPLNDVTMDERNLEFAFARLDIDKLRIEAQEIGQRLEGRPIEFTAYRGPLDDEPVLGTAEYSYASWHSKETALYIELPQRRYRFDRQAGGEFGMTYLGRSSDGALYRFALAGDHKGDDYYKGGSGAPIVDSRGKVVSLLIGPDPSPNVLTGLPIRDYVRWLI